MIKRWLAFVLITSLILLILPAPTQAQQRAAAWHVTILDTATGSVSQITPNGVQLVASFPTIPTLGDNIWRVRLSPDERFLVFEANTSADGSSRVYVADLQNNTCCTLLEDPLNAGLDIDWLGPISPDSTQVAIAASSMQFPPANFTPLIQVFDLATGAMVNSMAVSDLESEFDAPIAAFGAWKQDGIRLTPSCIACEGVWQGNYQIWNPQANTLSAPVEPFDVFRTVLPATGEQIFAGLDPAFPASGQFAAYVAPGNVVSYYSDAYAAPQTVYFNMDNLYIERAAWVMDGSGILAMHAGPFVMGPDGFPINEGAGPAYLILRDGTQIPASQTTTGNFFTGTPDGWLTRDNTTGALAYHQYTNGAVQVTPLGALPDSVRAAGGNFTLGSTASGTFPAVSPPAPTVCDGFMESRLAPNQIARVTPGPANNMRANPTSTAASVGQIPGDEFFLVLDGPVCAENMAWWQVNYQGTVGWTSEGQGTDYWLMPPTY